MQTTLLRTSCLAFALSASSVFAQTVSEDGAKQVTAALSSYLGNAVVEKGLLTVKPEGNAYRVSLDLQKAAEGSATATITTPPLTFLTAPKADGTWDVTAEGDSDITMTPKAGNDSKPAQLSFKDFSLKGTFDPKLGLFSKALLKVGAITATSADNEVAVMIEYRNMVSDITATPANGGANVAMVQSVDGLTETIKGPTGPMTIELGAFKGDTKIDGMRSRDLLGIWAFFVANATESDVTKLAPQFKDRLMAALPLWQNAVIDFTVKDVVVESPVGMIKMAEFQEKLALSGMVPKGLFGASFKIKGIELPPGIVPAWAKGIVPTDFDITAELTDVNLDSASRLFVSALDFTKKKALSDEAAQAIGVLIMAGKPKLTISPSNLMSQSLKVSFKGTGGFTPLPGGKLIIEAEGLDQTLQALSSANDEKAKQIIGSLGMAKMLAQQSGAKHSWTVEGDASGKITVNGKPLGPQ